MRIGFDFDSVITDSTHLKQEHCRRLYGIELPPEIFKWDTAVETGILTPEQYRRIQYEVHSDEERNTRMRPVDEVLTYLPKLIGEGHDIRIVTNRGGLSAELAQQWLERNHLSLPLYGMGQGASKAPACAGLEMFVDDDLDKLEQLVGIVPNRFLYDWKFNRHHDEQGVAVRVKSWEEIYDIVQDLSRRCA